MALDIKSPGPPDGGTGADGLAKAVRAGDDHHNPAILTKEAPFAAAHVSAGRILTYALASGADNFAAWQDAALVWSLRLSLVERAAVFMAAAWAAPPETIDAFIEGRIWRAGEPPIPFVESLAEAAENWASLASRGELRAVAAASSGRLPDSDRRHLARVLGCGG